MGRPVPERAAAKLAGERYYDTGQPCKNGHLSKRYTGTGICATCATLNTLRCQAKGREHPNRTAARASDEKFYATGEPCQNGHLVSRYVSTGVCVTCAFKIVKRHLARHPGIEAARTRKRRAKDPTKHRKASLKWAKQNKTKIRDTYQRWRKENLELSRALGRMNANNRRARRLNNGGFFTLDDVAILFEKQKGLCAACSSDDRLEIDHIMPLVLGGRNDPSNLQLLCLPCNRSKGGKHPDEWLRSRATQC